MPTKKGVKVLPGKPYITLAELDSLRKAGHSVGIYPRKGQAVVDGFKYYNIRQSRGK